MEKMISADVIINAPIEEVWAYFTQPRHRVNWNHAYKDGACSTVGNILNVIEKFSDAGSEIEEAINLEGVNTEVTSMQSLAYLLKDGRKIKFDFIKVGNQSKITQYVELKCNISLQDQKQSAQLILDNFKTYVEGGGCWV